MNSDQSLTRKSNNKKLGGIVKKPGSNRLYVSFRYCGKRIEKSSGREDTPENRETVNDWLNRARQKIASGTFRFEEAFPGASEAEKEYFSRHEGYEVEVKPRQVLMGDYISHWMATVFPTFPSESKKRDYRQVIYDWLLPYFAKMNFRQFTRVELQKFINQLKWRQGGKQGEHLSQSRKRNILIPLRTIWTDACDEYCWDLTDPFRNSGKFLPRSAKKKREVFRINDWEKLVNEIDPHYKPAVEVMVMTGMIASEIAGLRKSDIIGDYIFVQNSIVRNIESQTMKTEYRARKVFIFDALRERLEEAIRQSDSDYVFLTKTGKLFLEGSFRKNYWQPAMAAAGLDYKVPYTMRHTFAAWALTMGMDPNRLVRLMGHNSKKMIYEVYGAYVEGLEKDKEKLQEYFGPDFC